MPQLYDHVSELLAIEGALGAAIVDCESGMALATSGDPGFDLEIAAAGNANVIRAKVKNMELLGISGEIEDILITLDKQYHLINVMNGRGTKGLFVYTVLNRATANLALARNQASAVAAEVTV